MSVRKYQLFVRLISWVLAGILVFNPVIAPVVYAIEGEEGDGSGAEEVVEEKPAEEGGAEVNGGEVEEVSPENIENEATDGADGEATIETGDAAAESVANTQVNTNVDCVAGEVTTPDDPCANPEIATEGECGNETFIGNDNEAAITDEASSSAQTGENQILDAPGDALINTGNASATSSAQNQVNTNEVILDPDEAEASAGEEEEGADEASSVLVVANENDAAVTNDLAAEAGTGANQASENGGDATIETGDALALANLLNILNTNVVGGDFQILLENYLDGHEGDIDLNQMWRDILGPEAEGLEIIEQDGEFFLVLNDNTSVLINDVDVTADSGANQANENRGDATIETGDATALANVIDLVNLNLVGSDFFLGVINILGDFMGDLILPRPEMFANGDDSSADGDPDVVLSNNNSARIKDSVEASASSGSNQENNNQGDESIKSGDAQAQANSSVVANLNIQRNNWYAVLINHLGHWFGAVFGWEHPEAESTAGAGSLTSFILPLDQEQEETSTQDEGNDFPDGVIANQNEAQVTNDINVTASSGSNQANDNQGDASITTGRATALANLFDLVNLNVFGSRWFLGIVNILGDWTGNIFFAYPDMVVYLSNGGGKAIIGEHTSYTVNYVNQGHDQATGVRIALELPVGITYLGDSSGLPVEINGQTCSWLAGDLPIDAGGSFQIEVQVEPDFAPTRELSFWENLQSKLIRPVMAAENGFEVVATAVVGTPDPESDSSNNAASAKTIIYPFDNDETNPVEPDSDPGAQEGDGVDHRQPILEISAWNNVGEFVYPGDIISFEITVKNTSDVPAYNTYVYQELFNGVPDKGFGAAGFDVGTVEPGQQLVLSFGLKLNGGSIIPAGYYHTEAQAIANAPDGVEVASNQARTDFRIEWKYFSSVFVAEAKEEDELLGMIAGESCVNDEDVLPYLLAFLVSGLWIVEKSRKNLSLVKKGGS